MHWRRDVLVLTGDFTGLVVPSYCVVCGASAPPTVDLAGANGREIKVPHCHACRQRSLRRGTFNIAVSLAAVLVTACFAGVAPLLWPGASLWVYLLATLLLSALPAAVGLLLFGDAVRADVQHAVWWMSDGALACVDGPFARRLLASSPLATGGRCHGHRSASGAVALGPVLALLICPPLYYWFHPLLVVLNLGLAPLTLHVDGAPYADVEPTLREAPGAGARLRLPRGAHTLEVFNRTGLRVAHAQIRLEGLRAHLYAPVSDTYCLWLERTRYGRDRGRDATVLRSGRGFWRFEEPIDSWFIPSPDPIASDRRSSGGTLTAVRYALCHDAPSQVRDASSGFGS
jgi:hypothetical protein